MKWTLDEVVLSPHALEQMTARGIAREQIAAVLIAPEAVTPVRTGRVVAQRTLQPDPAAGRYLYRVFLDVDREPPVVVTAYRTSQIEKYRINP